MPIIEVNSDGNTHRVALLSGTLSVGRHKDNDIIVDDTLASRRHCVFTFDRGRVILKDLDSHNGTYLGRNRVAEAVVSFGDVVRIGKTTLQLIPDEIQVDTPRHPMPTAEIILDDEPEAPLAARPSAHKAAEGLSSTASSARTAGLGPLTRQLAPIIQASLSCPTVKGAPNSPEDIRLLDRQSNAVQIDSQSNSRPAEALQAYRQLLYAAFRTRATDIHLEPKGEVYQIRFRIDGLLHTVGDVSPKLGVTILNIVKVLCEQDIAKKAVVQEGSFSVELATRRVDFRVSMTPSIHGQKLALRILDKTSVPDRFEDLGMDVEAVQEVRRVCGQDAGLVIVAGPTGSGKTTTLYTALKGIDARGRNIVTIEDPVEYQLESATQISIDAGKGITFATVLSTVMRQDPDVILVGEIRDKDTAQMAMQAAMTGHLVLTTVHARDSVSIIFRLLDLGVERYLVANAVSMTISQRLVRKLCDHCKRPYRPEARLLSTLGLEGRGVERLFAEVGCARCMNTGFHGRLALFEMLAFSPQIRDVILTTPTIKQIRAAAGEWMFRTLRTSGLAKAMAGLTTVDEVERVASDSSL